MSTLFAADDIDEDDIEMPPVGASVGQPSSLAPALMQPPPIGQASSVPEPELELTPAASAAELEEQVAELVARIVKRFGQIDGLVTLASVWKPTPLAELSAAQIQKQFMVNALGTVLCAQKVGMQMVKQGSGGAIVTVGDWAVDRPYPEYIGYFLSKGGLETATKALAVELAALNENIRVNCIHPGNILFPDELSPEHRSEIQAMTPIDCVDDPEPFCQAVSFFLENRMVTGTSIKIDSGRSLE